MKRHVIPTLIACAIAAGGQAFPDPFWRWALVPAIAVALWNMLDRP